MEITKEKEADALSLPIPIYKAVRIGKAISRDKEDFIIYAGLSEELVSLLREHSLDPADSEIQNKTADRARFGLGLYEDWYVKGRLPFVLVHEESGALAAIVWFGPKVVGRKSLNKLSLEERKESEILMDPANWHTLAYRSYPPFRGKGLMKGFTKFAMDIYDQYHPKARYWTGLDANNLPSLRLAEALGFRISDEASDESAHWLVMIKK